MKELTQEEKDRILSEKQARIDRVKNMPQPEVFKKIEQRIKKEEQEAEEKYEQQLAEYKQFSGSSLDWGPPPPKRRQK